MRDRGRGYSGDIWWEQIDSIQRQMVPQGNAKIINLGQANFDAIDAAQLAGHNYSTAPIPGNNDSTNQLNNNDVFAVLTKSGDYAKIQVTSYGYNPSIKWETYNSSTMTTYDVSQNWVNGNNPSGQWS